VKTLDVGGHAVAYVDSGQGTGVILAHCSSATHRMWTPVIEALGSRYRVMAPDLIGYGRSTPWPADQPFDTALDAEILVRLARAADGPVHLVGHSYGGAAALEAARQLGDAVRTLTLIEPVAFHLLPQAGRIAEWQEVSELADAVRAAVLEGNLRRAAAVFMSYWIGRVRWWLMPRRQKERVVPTMTKVTAEFEGMRRIRTRLEDYRCVKTPTLLVAGGRTRRPTRAIVDILSESLPSSRLRVLPGAGHMSPFTHRDEIRELVVEHVDAGE
jgi:pimeloyl-ACP methyl ester carboxylesterase